MPKIGNRATILTLIPVFGIGLALAQDQTTTTNTQNSSSSTTSTQTATDPNSGTQSTTKTDSQTTRQDQATTTTDGSQTVSKSSKTVTESSRNRVVDTDKPMVGEYDKKFLTDAADGGLMEVQLAQMAQRQASSQAVKDYAAKLEQDHTAANKQLSDIATQRGIQLPTSATGKDSQAMVDKLSKLNGAEFDKAYIKMMVKDHRKDVKEFEKESVNGMDSGLKAFASSTLPTLKEHLQNAEQIEKGGSMTATSTTTTSVSESTRSRGKGETVVEKDKSTINKITPAPAKETTTTVDQTTTNPDGSVRQDTTTVDRVTTKTK